MEVQGSTGLDYVVTRPMVGLLEVRRPSMTRDVDGPVQGLLVGPSDVTGVVSTVTWRVVLGTEVRVRRLPTRQV